MSRPRIGIAHQTVMIGDAIGNDIAGMYTLLERCGYDVSIVCEHIHPEAAGRHQVIAGFDLPKAAADLDMLLYHHSVHWPVGEQMLLAFPGPVVVKYHNITPPEFFAPYTERYRLLCAEGRAQTARMAAMPNIVRWQSDSRYNCTEIGQLGVPEEKRGTVPPFNHIDRAFAQAHRARYPREGPFHALFVGRRVPNKGHVHILRTLAAWRDLFPRAELRCRMIGSVDGELATYFAELQALETRLGVTTQVEWLGHIDDAMLQELFATSHLYLNLSEHEGFCVPLIEAQALGLPTLSTNAAAIRETAGWDQLTVPVPRSQGDYDLLAGLAHEICVSQDLRRVVAEAGYRNTYHRFTSLTLESTFLVDLEPVLRTLRA